MVPSEQKQDQFSVCNVMSNSRVLSTDSRSRSGAVFGHNDFSVNYGTRRKKANTGFHGNAEFSWFHLVLVFKSN